MNIFLLALPLFFQDSWRVVCFGDSTTAPRAGVVPYCQQLERPGLTMINRGVPGNTTEHARARFEKDVLAVQPNLVIIQFGINDSSVDVWKKPPETAPRVSLRRYVENLSYFVDSVRAAGGQVVLMTFNPLTWTTKLKGLYGQAPYRPDAADGFNEGRTQYNEAVRQLSRDKQVRLIEVDGAYRASETPLDDLLLDGIHPNTRGHALVTGLLRDVLAGH